MSIYDVVIIGGGNLGLWTAYHLARRGIRRIAVCERYWAGFGATSRSAGVVRQQGGSETAVKLGIWSRALYQSLGKEIGLDSGFIETGYFVAAETEAERSAFLDLVELRRRCGVESEWIDAAAAARRFPQFNWEQFLGATYTPNDGYVHPPIVARNITYAVMQSEAVDLFESCNVEAIESTTAGYRIRTSRGSFEAGQVVNAAGPRGAKTIASLVDIPVPVSAGRHHVVTFPTVPDDMPQPFPMVFALAQGYYVRPEEQGVLLGFSNPAERADPSQRYQLAFDWDYFERLRPMAQAAFPAIAGQAVSRVWAASIDYTPDHLPIIDEPRNGFFVLAAGGHGMMWGPALGMKMAELVTDEKVTDLPDDEVRMHRFTTERAVRDTIALPFPEE